MVVRSAKTCPQRDEGILREAPTQAERTGAIHAGWNDAAWARPRRILPARLTRWYELGYAGGLVFRRREHPVDLVGDN